MIRLCATNLILCLSLPVAAFFVSLTCLAAEDEGIPATGTSPLVIVTADKLRLDPDARLLDAEGNVTIEVPDLEVSGEHAVIDQEAGKLTLESGFQLRSPELRVTGQQLVFDTSTGRMDVTDPEVELLDHSAGHVLVSGKSATCRGGRCQLELAHGTACPHTPTAYHVVADRAVLHPAGDVDLTRPVLVVGDTPVAALPWLRVRPSDSAGLLPPRLAWDTRGGLVIGPAGQFPLGAHVMARGHVAARTAEGLEAYSSLSGSAGEIGVFQLLDIPSRQQHARLRSQLEPELEGATLVLEADVVDGYQVIDATTLDPIERAVSHTSSRALLTLGTPHLVLETSTAITQSLEDIAGGTARTIGPTTAISLALVPPPLLEAIWPTAELSFLRHDSPSAALEVSQPFPVPSHSRLRAAPAISLPHRLGPFGLEVRASSLHQLWLPDRTSESTTTRHLFAASSLIELPLSRRLGQARHVITPSVRYRVTPWIAGRAPAWTYDGYERLAEGHGVEAGLLNVLLRQDGPSVATLEVVERIDLPGLGRDPGFAYLFARGVLGPNWLTVRADAAFDHRRSAPSMVSGTLSSMDSNGNLIETGLGWYAPGRGPHLDGHWYRTTGPWLQGTWPDQPDRVLGLTERAVAWFTRNWGAFAGARVGIYPLPGLQALWYGLQLRSSCGCLALGLTASHRPASWVPDVLASIRLLEY